jgi:Ni/Co efflux regulator RcnB
MKKVLVSLAAVAAVAAAGFTYAQQATTGQNQSNPKADQQQGPVGTNPTPDQNTRLNRNNRDNSMSSGTTTTPSSAAGTTSSDRSNERPARADRN